MHYISVFIKSINSLRYARREDEPKASQIIYLHITLKSCWCGFFFNLILRVLPPFLYDSRTNKKKVNIDLITTQMRNTPHAHKL